jgi:hypothetical protein
MDMTNKQVRIIRTSTISFPQETIIDVEVLEEKSAGVRSVVASFELRFEGTYGGPNDPALLLAIQQKLEQA